MIEQHAHLADGLLPWMIGLVVGAAGLYWWHRTSGAGSVRQLPRWAVVIVTMISVAAAVGTIVEVVLIGHTGATAAWGDVG